MSASAMLSLAEALDLDGMEGATYPYRPSSTMAGKVVSRTVRQFENLEVINREPPIIGALVYTHALKIFGGGHKQWAGFPWRSVSLCCRIRHAHCRRKVISLRICFLARLWLGW